MSNPFVYAVAFDQISYSVVKRDDLIVHDPLICVKNDFTFFQFSFGLEIGEYHVRFNDLSDTLVPKLAHHYGAEQVMAEPFGLYRPGFCDVVKQGAGVDKLWLYRRGVSEVFKERHGNFHDLHGMPNDIFAHLVLLHEFKAFTFGRYMHDVVSSSLRNARHIDFYS